MLIGNHIFLRSVVSTDVDFILSVENNTENWAIGGITKPFTRKEIIDFVASDQNLHKNKQLRFIICEKRTEQPIGTIDLFEYNKELKNVGIGILIEHKESRRKGFATEAIKLIIRHCKTELNIIQLFCNIFKDNKNSIRLFEKCGFNFIEEKTLFNKPVNHYTLTYPKHD